MKTQTKSRALLVVCVLVLAMALTAVFAFSASAADVTEMTEYSVVLTDGVDIKVSGTVAEADLAKDIKLEVTQRGKTEYAVEVDAEGAFEVVIPVPATKFGDDMAIGLVVDGDVVDAFYPSVKDYCATILADDEADAGLKLLVSDIIRYGAAVLTYADAEDEAEALVDGLELVAAAQYNFAPKFSAEKSTDDADIAITEIAMELDGRINLVFKTNAAAVDASDVVADGYDVVAVEDDDTSFKVVGIPVSAFFEGITVGVYNEDTLVSNEVTYSPTGYIVAMGQWLANKYEGNLDEITAEEQEVLDVLQMLYNYATTAHMVTTHDEVVTVDVATCQAEGLKTTVCEGCGYHDEEVLPVDAAAHSEISYAVNAGVITYTCEGCEETWSSTSLLLADGTATSMLEGNTSNLDFVGGTNFPNVVDGHYEFVKTATTEVASHGQFRLVRTTAGTAPSGASVVANRLGFVSISLQAVDSPVDKNPNHNYSWALQLANNASGSQWGTTKGKSKGFPILTGVAGDGSKAETLGGVVIDLAENGFTRIDISFVSVENDMYLLTYYVDGTLVDTIVVDNILFNYTPHCLYFDCYATEENQSVVFDDLTLAFADAASAGFFPKNHVHVAGTEAEMIDANTHGVKCEGEGCDVFVGTSKHEYDFAGSTCAGGVATGECVCGATTTKTIEHTLVAQGIASNVVTYECAVCEAVYTMNVGFGSDMSGNVGFTIQDLDEGRAGVADGVFTQSAGQDVPDGRENGYIAVYPQGKITSTTTMLLGFDIKNTENRAGYFRIQWRTPGTGGNWALDGDETKLEIKPDGSIYFANRNTDTGFDISETEFTSILMKATLVEDGANTTLYVDLWVNGQYAGTATKTKATTGCSWLTSGSGAQICVENNKGTNEVILDNLFVADVPAGAEGTALVNYLTAAE